MITHAIMVLTVMSIGQAARPNDRSDATLEQAQPPQKAQATELPTAPPVDMGAWLVHLAQHQGHLVGRSDPRSATLHVLALLSAAAEVAPQYPETYYWLYDLQYRMGRDGAARDALANYVRLAPGDDAARIRYVEMELEKRQTAEQRAEYVKEQLAKKPLSRAYESELRRWLANYYYERRENEYAMREVEKALRLNPMNVAARELAYEMFGETEPALQRVEMALQLISINPTQANLVWDLAEFLDRLSLHTQAQEWYNRALDLHRRADAGPIPPEFWHKLAMSYSASGDYAKAREAAGEALAVDESFHIARLLRAHASRKLGDDKASAADMNVVLRAYESRVDEIVENKLADEAAQAAWFFCYHHPDKDRALKLAQVAMGAPDPSSLARLAYGYALGLSGRTDEAVEVLDPLVDVDQLAALERAKIAIGRGNKALAMTILHKAATIQYSGIAYDLIRDLLARYDETAAQPPLHSKVVDALNKFHRDIFDFHKRPGDFLRFTMRVASEPLLPVGRINVVFRLENVGPFPITFGEGFMCRPLVALTARVGDAEGKLYRNYLQVLMNARPLLVPGDAVERIVAIDVGPLRSHLIRTVTQPQEIVLTAMFDPICENGELVAGLGTILAEPVKTIRPAAGTSPQAIAALLDRADSEDVSERVFAAQLIGALLSTAEGGLAEAKAVTPSTDRLDTALATLLSDPDWRVRAHALTAAGWSKLDSRVTIAAAPTIRDQDGVVKLLAVRLFARQHAGKFEKVLEQLSRDDPHPYVRIMARSFLRQSAQVLANSPMGDAPDPEP